MNILSIQSHVAYGHAGNSAAVFALQRLGCEAWPVHTVQFSNHTGYGSWKGRVFDAGMVREVVEGIAGRGVLPDCDGVLSGYIGSPEIGEAILESVAMVRAANPSSLYCCDPVIGDVGRGVFVRQGVPEFMRDRALALADIITPNHFELDYLTGATSDTVAQVVMEIDKLHACGPRAILVTSLATRDAPADAIDLLASDAGGAFRVRTPRLPISVNGAGDAVAAMFFVHYLRLRSAAPALSAAASAIFGVIRRTAQARSRELLLIAAQDELVNPTMIFDPEPI